MEKEGYGEAVAQQLFIFVQLEFPWELGPPDGRYLLRSRRDGRAERVVVIGTLGAGRASAGAGASTRARRPPVLARLRGEGGRLKTTSEPSPVATARVTIVDPVSLSAESQARAWLKELDAEREARAAVAVLNRVLHSYRIASADPYVHEVSAEQALVIRAGWGEGEQVADGHWLHAQELLRGQRRRSSMRSPGRAMRGRSAALRPQERLAELLGARGVSLLCEELALRARLDLDQGRVAHAALQLDGAFTAALAELRSEGRQDLAIRIDELEHLRIGVARQARAAVPDAYGLDPDAGTRASTTRATAASDAAHDGQVSEPQEEIVRHALERLEAALRARSATGFSLQ